MSSHIAKRNIIFITSLALFMEALDSSILNTAVPTISSSLNINPINLKIALISYLMSLAIFIPISGWLADKYGVKHVFMAALGLFSISSFYCGFSQHITELVLGRFLQGIGGALMTPTARLLLLRAVDKHEFINIMGRVIMIAAVGVILGPLLGGFIVHYFSWPWIFWVNVPVSILALLIAYYGLNENHFEDTPPLDIKGFVLFGSGLASFSFALSAFSESSIPGLYSLLIALISILLLLGYFLHSKKEKNPVIKIELFHARTFRLSILGNFLSRIGFEGTPFALPLLLQIGLNYSALTSGLLIAPIALGVIFSKPLIGFLVQQLGYRRLLTINTLLLASSVCSFSYINASTSFYFIASLCACYGFLISIQYAGMNTLAYSDQITKNYGYATSLVSTVQRIAQSFGVATTAFFIRLFSPQFTIPTPPNLIIFQLTFLAMGCVTLFSLFVFTRLKKGDGRQMIDASA